MNGSVRGLAGLVLTLGLGCVTLQGCPDGSTWDMDMAAAQRAYSQGRLDEAARLYAAASLKAEQFGTHDPRVAYSLSQLAHTYHAQGRDVEAEPLYVRALAIYQDARGAEHPDVAAMLNNLGVLHRLHGQYAEAEPLLKRALAIKEQVLGAEHPDVALTLSNLGILYVGQGDYSAAEPAYRRALSIREKALPPGHPDLVKSLRDYGELLRKMGRDEEGERVLLRIPAAASGGQGR